MNSVAVPDDLGRPPRGAIDGRIGMANRHWNGLIPTFSGKNHEKSIVVSNDPELLTLIPFDPLRSSCSAPTRVNCSPAPDHGNRCGCG